MATMSAFAMTALGVDSETAQGRARPKIGVTTTTTQTTSRSASTSSPPADQQSSEARTAARSSRRILSNYNTFQTSCTPASDDPPSYSAAVRHKYPLLHSETGREHLPKYTCTVATEAKVLLALESVNPFHDVGEIFWKEVYVVLRGTLLSIFRVKDNGPGRLLKSYTLQHAELGLATDSEHTILHPQSRLAYLIPTSARRKAYNKDPALFKAVKQTILRIRAETDQFLLADSSEDRIHELINAISAAIDISTAIDERSVPKQCTVPRRRRRPAATPLTGNLNDPTLLAEQERILREMYPAFAARNATPIATQQRPSLVRTETEDQALRLAPTMTRDEDEIDLSMIREDSTETGRPAMSRNVTASSTISTASQQPPLPTSNTTANAPYIPSHGLYATPSNHFSEETGKWQPPHRRTAGQIQRYVRRCMPILLADAPRASDIIICNGRRVRINTRAHVLDSWQLKPPSYRYHMPAVESNTAEIKEVTAQGMSDTTHGGEDGGSLERVTSQQSAMSASSTVPDLTASTTQLSVSPTTRRNSSSNSSSGEDEIEPVDSHPTMDFELSKSTTSTGSPEKRPVLLSKFTDTSVEATQPSTEVHGVVYCF